MKKILTTLITSAVAALAMAQVSFGDASLFNDQWLFNQGDEAAAVNNDFDDQKWRKLDLPHDWSVEGRLSPTLASCTGYLPAGIAWYRKHFTLTDGKISDTVLTKDANARTYIYFEGVYNRSEVYLNGHLLGVRPSGFASFLYDMTPYLQECDNVISVRVDHSRIADSRWYTGSGIYRDVWIISAPEVHLAQWGTGYSATKITDSQATVAVEVAVDGASSAKRGLLVKVEIVDAKGKSIAKRSASVKAVEDAKTTLNLNVPKPHRWSLSDPYLYTIKTQLIMGGKVIDGNEIKAGLRTLTFDANKGFALNGNWMKVKGVCLHHDAGTLGAVVPEAVWERRLIKLKEIGVNAIRCSHNPQAPVLYDICDRLGLLMMDEASDEWEFPKRKWVEGWNVGTPAFDGTYDFFEEWIDRDVTDMVRRDRNHPSIIMWSIGNEVDYPNDPYSHPILDGGNAVINQPMFGGYDPKRPNAERIGKIAKRLAACVRNVDTSRPVTGALAGVVMSNQTEYPEAVDVVGYNYTENRYDEDHQTYPDRVIYGSENGVGYEAWTSVRDKEFIFGQFIWTGTDYLGESGRWPSRGLHTGLLDFGSFPKPRGHFRASLWCETPVCYAGTYINRPMPQRGNRVWISTEATDTWNYEAGQEIRVVCYTNAPQAKLILNGKQVGDMKPYDMSNGIIYWDIPFEAGDLRAVACDKESLEIASYTIQTSGRPYELRARFDNVIGTTTGDVAVSSKEGINHIVVEVFDENGHIVKLADNNITCSIEGPAQLLGLENSDNTDMGDYRDNQQRVFQGSLLTYIRNGKDSGKVIVRFTSPLLKSAEISFEI